MKIHIENVPYDATEQEVRQFFSVYGKVQSVMLTPGTADGKQAGTVQVDPDVSGIEKIRTLPDQRTFKGTVIRIRYEQSETNSQSAAHPLAPSDRDASSPPCADTRTKYMYRIVSVETVADPSTGESNGWCRYSIESQTGSITGLRRGTLPEVRLYAEEATEAFNLRNMLGHTKSPPLTNQRKK